MAHQSIAGPIGGIAISLVFIAYGMTRRPLCFNNWWPRPLSVRAARMVYLPIGLLFSCLSVRQLILMLR
jgi:hypothetical protein